MQFDGIGILIFETTFAITGGVLTIGPPTIGSADMIRSEDLGTGWYRVSISTDKGIGGFFPTCRYALDNAGDRALFAFGQWEEQPAATQYIRTSGAAVIRAEDKLLLDAANVPFGPSNYSMSISGLRTPVADMISLAITGEPNTNRFYFYPPESASGAAYQVAGNTMLSDNDLPVQPTDFARLAGTHDEGVASTFYIDSVAQLDTEVGARGVTTPLNVVVGGQNSTRPWYGRLKELRIYTTALTQEEITFENDNPVNTPGFNDL
jgi:hypothetical protein